MSEDELEWLRARHDEALLVMGAMEVSIDTLRAERDEARRMWCEAIWLQGGVTPPKLAADKGWDCYERKAQ